MSPSELEEDLKLSSRYAELRRRVRPGFRSHLNLWRKYAVVAVKTSLGFPQLFWFSSSYDLLQNEFLEKAIKQKERELNLHKAEFDVRRKGFFSFKDGI